ncbi:hypothetical protein B4U80_09969 [Leptotrombidium deliense]|uniref:Uncharacterized protein n=1 Tax=Leptotrombidium deliense TaxID=299467 RepID=A0A443SNQ2_9ACAR|nr:hypothetical protein B4U80_09969 [Leptotrombidium deliense]
MGIFVSIKSKFVMLSLIATTAVMNKNVAKLHYNSREAVETR